MAAGMRLEDFTCTPSEFSNSEIHYGASQERNTCWSMKLPYQPNNYVGAGKVVDQHVLL